MDPDGGSKWVVLLLFLVLAALITLVRTALLAVNRHRLRSITVEIDPRVTKINRMLNELDLFVEAVRIGDIVFRGLFVIMGTVFVLAQWGTDKGIVIAAAAIIPVVAIIAYIIPETIAIKDPEKTTLLFIKPIRFFVLCMMPLIKITRLIKRILRRIMMIEEEERREQKASGMEEEIIELVSAVQEEGVIHQEEKKMIHGVFDFVETMVKDVMVPRTGIIAVEKDMQLNELMEMIQREQFSRIPVYENSIDNITGVVHIKDLFMANACGTDDFVLEKYLRPTIFVPETKMVNDLFRIMKKEKIHMGIVLDEYGGTAGLVTMEDLIEEIMGDIQDEHDTEEPNYLRIDESTIDVNASLRIEDINEKLGLELECDDAETVGGIVFAKLGRIPVVGDVLNIGELEMHVIKMDGHRIEKIRIKRVASTQNMD